MVGAACLFYFYCSTKTKRKSIVINYMYILYMALLLYRGRAAF